MMSNSNIMSTAVIVLLVFVTSCKTYQIPIDSFKQQFEGMNSSNRREVAVQNPLGGIVSYQSYVIDYIKAIDKKGHSVSLKNSPSVEIRLTDTLNRRTIFYFDTISLDGDTITGLRSRIIKSIRKSIPINSIKKIEVQNGKKNFHYVKPTNS